MTRFKRLVNSLIGPLVYFFGIDLNRIKSLANLPKFIMARSKFIRVGGQIGAYFPVLTDFESNAGIASGQYFHQDLLVASFIYNESPLKHVDVGSRIDGFVAHRSLCQLPGRSDRGPSHAAGQGGHQSHLPLGLASCG